MKKLLFALAGTAAFAAFADPATGGAGDISWVGFENYTNETTVIGVGDDGTAGQSLWSCAGDDASLVKTYGGDNATAPSISRPALFAEEANTQYLALDTNGSELQRAIPAAGQAIAADGTYIDTLVQFTPSESAPTGSDLAGAKLAIWLGVVNNVTNLYVQGGFLEGPSGEGTPTIDTAATQAYKLGNIQIEPGQWYRLTVKAVKLDDDGAGNTISGFQILVDGTLAVSDTAVADAAGIQYYTDYADEAGVFPGAAGLLSAKTLIPSCAGVIADATLTSVGFKGTGALDDFVVTTAAPDFAPPMLDFTLTWPTSLTSVSYTLDGTAGDALTIADGTVTIRGTNGAPVTLTGSLGYADKTVTGSITANGTLALTADIGLYFPLTATPDQDGTAAHPFEVADATGLQSLQAAVAALADARGLCYAQTGNIDMSSAGPFPGIGTYAANLNSGVAFTGTYDGQGYKISNIDFTQRNYGGIFNQVKGGTIKNLTVENITCTTFDASVNDGEWGCSIVGNAGLGATLQGLTAMGDFGTAAIPCSHNVAGIAIRVCGGASNVVNGVTMLETLVKDCTNNAALHGTYTKLGGISALTQDQNGVPNDYVTYDGCVNNGTITATANANGKNPGTDGISGIVAYTSDATVLKDCVNTGTYSSVYASARGAELVGYHQGKTLTDLGGNKGDATKKFVYTQLAGSIVGFQYATVDNGVATTTLTLAKDGEYLLEGSVAAALEPEFTFAAAGTISFDTALGYTFDGLIDAASELEVTVATNGTVITYTAASSAPPVSEDWVDDSTSIPANTLAATQYPSLAGTDLADADAKELTDWAKANSVVFSDAVSGATGYVEPFLLNCAPTAAAVEAEKDAFVLNITMAADGTPTVTTPDGKTYNGTLQLKGSNDLSTWTDVSAASSTYKFYKAVLSL